MPRLCVLGIFPPDRPPFVYDAFVQGLQELGYEPGRKVIIDHFSADGQFDRFPVLAARCVELQPDVIVTVTTPGALTAKKATSTIPIVAPSTNDPVATGIVASLARPGGT